MNINAQIKLKDFVKCLYCPVKITVYGWYDPKHDGSFMSNKIPKEGFSLNLKKKIASAELRLAKTGG